MLKAILDLNNKIEVVTEVVNYEGGMVDVRCSYNGVVE